MQYVPLATINPYMYCFVLFPLFEENLSSLREGFRRKKSEKVWPSTKPPSDPTLLDHCHHLADIKDKKLELQQPLGGGGGGGR